MSRRAPKNLFTEIEPDIAPDTLNAPLAERMRPRNLAEFVGQSHLVGEGRVLRRLIEGAGALPCRAGACERETCGAPADDLMLWRVP